MSVVDGEPLALVFGFVGPAECGDGLGWWWWHCKPEAYDEQRTGLDSQLTRLASLLLWTSCSSHQFSGCSIVVEWAILLLKCATSAGSGGRRNCGSRSEDNKKRPAVQSSVRVLDTLHLFPCFVVVVIVVQVSVSNLDTSFTAYKWWQNRF